MSSNIEFLFDFASPNAYLSYHVLKRRRAPRCFVDAHACVTRRAFKLTNNQAPMVAFGEVKGKLDYDMLETQRFIAASKLDQFKFNRTFPSIPSC